MNDTEPDLRDLPIADLFELSSFGTPEARARRAETPLEVRREMLARLLRPEPKVIVVFMQVPRLGWSTWPAKFLGRLQDFCSRIM